MSNQQAGKQKNRSKEIEINVPARFLVSAITCLVNNKTLIDKIALNNSQKEEFQIIYATTFDDPINLTAELVKVTEGNCKVWVGNIWKNETL
jgi:hypothetical protein